MGVRAGGDGWLRRPPGSLTSCLAESFYLEVTGLKKAQIPGDRKCFCGTDGYRVSAFSGQAPVNNGLSFLEEKTQQETLLFLLGGSGWSLRQELGAGRLERWPEMVDGYLWACPYVAGDLRKRSKCAA